MLDWQHPVKAYRQWAGANAKLVVLIITAFVDMMGTLMVVPLLFFYQRRLGGNGLIYTMLVSTFSLATLVAAPLWGRFSDRYGRRPTLLIALAASAVSYVIFGFANSLAMLFLSRLVQGAGGGTVGVLQAYVSDAVEPKNRARALGWISAATNLGVTLGPFLGSAAVWFGGRHFLLGGRDFSFGYTAPGIFAALICVANMYYAWRHLHETRVVAASDRNRVVPRGRARAVIWSVIRHSEAPPSRLIWIYAIAIGAYTASLIMFAPLLVHLFNVSERTFGYYLFFGYMGVLNVVARAIFLGPLVDRFGEARLSRFGIALIALGLFCVPLTHSVLFFAIAAALVPLGASFTFSCVTAMLSRVISADERGLYMGTQQTFGGVTRGLFPLGAGFLLDNAGIIAPLWAGAGVVAVTLLLGLDAERYLQRAPAVAVPPQPPEIASVGQAPVASEQARG